MINSYIVSGGLAIALLLAVKTLLDGSKRSRLPLPPGPKGYPIVGLLDIPRDKPWLVYNQWFKEYDSDIIYFKVLGTSFVVLGSRRRTNDLFEKRSSNYSDRMRFPMVVELMKMNYILGVLRYGNWWRRHRRLFHSYFHPNAVPAYWPIQLRETKVFLRRLLDTPEDMFSHIRLMFAASIMDIAYGIRVRDADDTYVSLAEEVLGAFSEATVPGKFLVDLMPILKYVPSWVPGAEFKRKAARWAVANVEFLNKPFNAVQESLESGTAVPSVARTMIEGFPAETDPARVLEEVIAKNTVAVAYGGGADTTGSAVHIFFLAMAMYPDVQRKAQAEIDAAVGNDRIPDFSDRANLPYINALLTEIMRWQIISPLAVPHMSTEDDEYDGYFIPKGTLVIGNAWSILHDPEMYKSPEEFIPERFLKDGKFDSDAAKPITAVFGYGRRICPGRYLSDNSLYAVVSAVLAVYDVEPPVDKEGNFVRLTPEMTNGVICYPMPFKCNVKPRSAGAEALIKDISA